VLPLQVEGEEWLNFSQDIPEDFISEMKEAFKLFDKKGTGFLGSKEIPQLLRTLGYNPTETEVNAITAEVEVDHNGKMDLSQFIVLMHNQVRQMMRRGFGRKSNYFLRMVQFSEKTRNKYFGRELTDIMIFIGRWDSD